MYSASMRASPCLSVAASANCFEGMFSVFRCGGLEDEKPCMSTTVSTTTHSGSEAMLKAGRFISSLSICDGHTGSTGSEVSVVSAGRSGWRRDGAIVEKEG